MYLAEISIKGFRLFSNFHLCLNPGLNVLVGENDSGKTTLIDAIRYTLGTNSAERTYVAEADFFNNCDSLTIQLKFLDIENNAFRFVEHLTHEMYEDEDGEEKRRSVLYVQLTARKTGTERRGYPYIQTGFHSGKDGNGLPLEIEVRDFLAVTYLKPLRDAEAELSTGRASRLSQILNSSKGVRENTVDILKIIAQANKDLLVEGGALKNSATNIRDNYLHKLIFEAEKETLGAFIDIAGVKEDGLENLTEADKRRHLRAILEGLSLTLSEDRRLHGLGYHNLLFMAAELLLLEQESEQEFPLLLIEEPEAHLHPQLQMKLLQFINSKVQSEDNPSGIQCILTTHSPNLSSKADPSEITMMGNGKAWSLRPGETELNPSDYVFVRKFLDVTKANIFFARAVIFVEGDSENILLPTIARLLGRPFEDYGVSIVKYDNSGSWKRFAKLFLRNGKDGERERWHPTKICVLRDLDLWPVCAEERDDGANPYGFIKRMEPGQNGRGGNIQYWELAGEQERANQAEIQKENHKKDNGQSLERQWIKVCISDRWTFEFCLARYGLFSESCQALGEDEVEGNGDNKATYIQSNVRKTDFAYQLAAILSEQLSLRTREALEQLDGQRDVGDRQRTVEIEAQEQFAAELRNKLPPYILEAIDYVTPMAGADG